MNIQKTNKCLFIAIFIILILIGCSSTPEYEVLKRFSSIDHGDYSETVLMSNFSNNIDTLKMQMIDYYQKRKEEVHQPISSIFFYKRTLCTKYFIDHDEDDSGGFYSNVLEGCDDKIGSIIISIDTTKNISNITIYDKEKDHTIDEDFLVDKNRNILLYNN